MNIYEKRTVCPYDCPDCCGMIAVTDGKKILSVKGDPAHPVTQGILCRKMQHYEEDIHSPHRILSPLKRVGEKGKRESFIPISWNAAISEIGNKWKRILETYGPEAILPYSYAGNMGMIQRNCIEAFFARLGASQLERTICSSARGAGVSAVMGNLGDWDSSEIVYSDFILLWGSNPRVNRLHVVPQIQAAKKAGAKVILIDTWRNTSSDLCDEVLLMNPGTNAALLLALMSELKREGYLDRDFIARYTTGYDALEKEFEQWTPQRAAEITGLTPADIRALAAQYGLAKKPMIIAGSGASRYTNGSAAFRLLLALPALTGAWKRGGGTSSFVGASNFCDKAPIKRPDWKSAKTRTINMNQLGSALADNENPIKSLYVSHSNPAVMAPDQKQILRGLARSDLFLVVHDRFLTDTALQADIILPAVFSVEQDDIFAAYGHYHIQVSRQVIPPAGDAKSNWDTFRLLAKEMGFTDDYWKPSAKELVEDFLETKRLFSFELTDTQTAQLRDGYAVKISQPDVLDIRTSDKKIHLAPCEMNYVPLKDSKYPLRLVVVHSLWSLNSNFSYRKDLMEGRGPLTLLMHPKDAYARRIQDKDICQVWNNFGEITVRVSVTEDVKPGTVIGEGVYQNAYTFGNGNFSSLLSQELTDVGNASTLNTNTVEVLKK